MNLTPSSVIFENILSVGLRMINALIIKDRVVKYQLFYKDKSTIMTNISESYRQCRKKDKRTEESKITTADNLKNRIENSSFDEGKFFKFFKGLHLAKMCSGQWSAVIEWEKGWRWMGSQSFLQRCNHKFSEAESEKEK